MKLWQKTAVVMGIAFVAFGVCYALYVLDYDLLILGNRVGIESIEIAE